MFSPVLSSCSPSSESCLPSSSSPRNLEEHSSQSVSLISNVYTNIYSGYIAMYQPIFVMHYTLSPAENM